MTGTEPVRWWCFDDAVPVTEVPLPPADSPVWEVCYANDFECGKRTSRKFDQLDPFFGTLTDDLREFTGEWSERLGYTVYDDPVLHGGGLHVTEAGGHLATHLDYALHPNGRSLRALNLIAFTHPEWDSSWGGQLYLADPVGNVVTEFEPVPGRLVAFEVSDLSYHGVRPTTPDAPDRVSVAVYMLCEADTDRQCDRHKVTRRRALFLPVRKG